MTYTVSAPGSCFLWLETADVFYLQAAAKDAQGFPRNVYTYRAAVNCPRTWLGIALPVEIRLLISKRVFHPVLQGFRFLPHFALPLPVHWFYFPDLRRAPGDLEAQDDECKTEVGREEMPLLPAAVGLFPRWRCVPVLLHLCRYLAGIPSKVKILHVANKGAVDMRPLPRRATFVMIY